MEGGAKGGCGAGAPGEEWGQVPGNKPPTPARAQGEVPLTITHAFCSPMTVPIVIGLVRLRACGELCPGLGSDGQVGSRDPGPVSTGAQRDPACWLEG